MRVAVVAIGTLFLAAGAAAQSGGPGDFGSTPGMTAPVRGGTADSIGPGAAAWAKRSMSEQAYIDELARQYVAARQLLGQPLTDKDRGRIRSAISRDLIAWRTQYDPRRKEYSAMREKWLLDENSLSPEGWAKQRVDWLRAQQEWIVARHRG